MLNNVNALIRRGASCLLNKGVLSSECWASRLGASFLWGEMSWGELSLGRVVLFPFSRPDPFAGVGGGGG